MIFLWIILYGLVYCVCTAVEGSPWVLPLGMLAYTAGFLLWISASGFREWIRLRKVPKGIPWQLLPVFIPAAGNLLLNAAAFPEWEEGLTLICVSITEELFFRGFLFQHLMKQGQGKAVLGTSLLFSLMHLGNLLGGAELSYTMAQLLFGFWSGVCYCLVILRWSSIYPCILAHVMINLTAAGTSGEKWIPAAAGYTAVYVVYSLWLCNHLRRQKGD